MGKSKKRSEEPAPNPDGVDMTRIRDMMGPLPDEHQHADVAEAVEKPSEPGTAPIVPKSHKAIDDAATEANEKLKQMSESLSTSAVPVKTIMDEPAEPLSAAFMNDDLATEGVVADDPAIVRAVEDIVQKEGDEVLEAEDALREDENISVSEKRSFGQRLKDAWAKPAVRWILFIIILLILLGVAAFPLSRYFILNAAGARSSLGVTVLDNSTQLPLKNATISANGITAQTDENGTARLQKIKLGKTTLHITKRAFADINQEIVVGWGSNPLGKFSLKPSGTSYAFILTDYLSGKPLEKVQASSGDGNAASDKTGKITLTLDTYGKNDADVIDVQFVLDQYRSEKASINVSTKTVTNVKLVPARKDVFVSNRSGKYDIYTVDIDGKNEKKIVSGTGIESPSLALIPQQDNDIAAYVATRENIKNSDGYLLSTLYMLDTNSGDLNKVDHSEQIQPVGWSSDGRFVYVKIAAGTSAGNSKRFRLQSVNSKNITDNKELASANSFNDVVIAENKILYAPSNALSDSPPGLYTINTDGTAQVRITDKQVYNIFRTNYTTVTILEDSNKYFTYTIGGAASTLTATNVPTNVNRLYLDNNSGKKSVWQDERDGKGLVLSYDKSTKKDAVLATAKGIRIPIRWLSDTVVIYRVNDGDQSADYAVSVAGGQAQKVTDVSDVAGIGRWYYY